MYVGQHEAERYSRVDDASATAASERQHAQTEQRDRTRGGNGNKIKPISSLTAGFLEPKREVAGVERRREPDCSGTRRDGWKYVGVEVSVAEEEIAEQVLGQGFIWTD